MALHAILFSRCIYAMDDSVEACLHHRSLSAKNCSRRHHAQVLEVDVAEGLAIIEEAEAENVLASLIDKAVKHVENAAQAQFAVA